MNDLTFFIYALHVVDNLLIANSGGIAVSACITATALFCGLFNKMEADGPYGNEHDTERAKGWFGLLKITVPILIVFALIAVIVPNKQTMIMMGAAQWGESLLKTEPVSDSLKLLNKYIKEALEENE